MEGGREGGREAIAMRRPGRAGPGQAGPGWAGPAAPRQGARSALRRARGAFCPQPAGL